MEKGLGELCLWGQGNHMMRVSFSLPQGHPHPLPSAQPYLQPLATLESLGSQPCGGGWGDLPDETSTPPTAA